MYVTRISNTFRSAITNEILTESRDTTDEYFIETEGYVIWLTTTILYFMVQSIFISKIKQHLMCCCPTGTFLSSYITLKDGWTIFNSLLKESVHRVLSFCLSILQDSSTVLGICMPNLWVRLQYLDLTLYIIQSHLLSMSGFHHAKDSFVSILLSTAYSSVIKGSPYMIYFNGFQGVSLSFRLTSRLPPFII